MKKVTLVLLIALITVSSVFASGDPERRHARVGYINRKDNEIVNQLSQESSDRIKAVDALQESVDEINSVVGPGSLLRNDIESLNNAINKNIEIAVASYRDTYNDMHEAVETNINDLTTESKERAKADKTLQNNIDAVRKDLNNTVNTAYSMYLQTYEDAKEAYDSVNGEIAKNQQSIASLQKNLDAHDLANKNDNTGLKSEISKLSVAFADVVAKFNENTETNGFMIIGLAFLLILVCCIFAVSGIAFKKSNNRHVKEINSHINQLKNQTEQIENHNSLVDQKIEHLNNQTEQIRFNAEQINTQNNQIRYHAEQITAQNNLINQLSNQTEQINNHQNELIQSQGEQIMRQAELISSQNEQIKRLMERIIDLGNQIDSQDDRIKQLIEQMNINSAQIKNQTSRMGNVLNSLSLVQKDLQQL